MRPGYVLGWVIGLWLIAIVLLIAYRILTGRITLSGLLTQDGDRFSPERMQMFLVTIGMLISYVNDTVSAGKMQAPSAEFIAVLAASHALYLGGKIARS